MSNVLLTSLALVCVAHDPPPTTECICATAQVQNGWCHPCQVGYFAGIPIKSAVLFDAIDTHGHEVIAERLTCPICREAIRTDGFCDTCNWGFVNQKMYYTKLTYCFARGQPLDAVQISCPTCREALQESGWCDKCRRGMVRHFAFSDRRTFESAEQELRRLQAALLKAEHCEYCAAVMFTGSECPKCKMLEYRRKRQSRPTPTPTDSKQSPTTGANTPPKQKTTDMRPGVVTLSGLAASTAPEAITPCASACRYYNERAHNNDVITLCASCHYSTRPRSCAIVLTAPLGRRSIPRP